MKNKQNFYYVASFVLPLMLLCSLWAVLSLAPFGNKQLLVSDLGTQYMPFLSGLKHTLTQGTLSTYSFFSSIGEPTLPLAAYYLMSPFHILIFLFPTHALPMVILSIITLKIACMGLTMFFYLKQQHKTSSIFTLLFSTSYSFCGFVSIYSLNFMWLDALILLPLLAYGLELLWLKKRYVLYSVTLFLAIVTNYYMGYMLCLFAVFYSLYLYYTIHDSQKKFWRSFLKDSKLFFVSSFFSGLATSFLLLPALEGMLQTKKAAFQLTSFLPFSKFLFSFFSQFGIGAANFQIRLDHLPTVFSGLLMTLLLVCYFLLPSVTKKNKYAAAGLLIAIVLSFYLEVFHTIWHMFQAPAGFPYRNTYIFSFLLIKFAYEAYLKLQPLPIRVSKKMLFRAALVCLSLLTLGYIALAFWEYPEWLLSYDYPFLTLFFILGNAVLLFYLLAFLQQKTKIRGFAVLFLLFVSAELCTNYWISLRDIPFGDQAQFEKSFATQQALIEQLRNEQATFFRIKQTADSKTSGYAEKNNGYNQSMLHGYAGIPAYSSTLNTANQTMLKQLGLFVKNDRRVAYVDDLKVVNLLLNVGYELTVTPDKNKPLLFQEAQNFVYKNEEALGTGFLVDQSFAKLTLKNHQPLANQEMILQALKKQTQPYFVPTEVTSSSVTQTPKTAEELTVTTNTEGPLYFYAPHLSWKKIDTFQSNGKIVQPPVAITTNQVFYLGTFKKGETITLAFNAQQPIRLTDATIATLDAARFTDLTTTLQQRAMQLTQQAGGKLTGTVTVTEQDENLLYLAIPYDKNWRVRINHEKGVTKKVLGNLMAIPLPAGTHQLTLTYQSNSFLIGSLISLIILISFASYQYRKQRERLT